MTDREVLQQIKALVDAQLGVVVTPPAGETREQMVTRLYREELHREPDAGGLAYWVSTGRSEADVRAEFQAYWRLHNPTAPPAPPPGGVEGNPLYGEYAGRGNPDQLRLASGQVKCYPLPDTGGMATGSIVFGEQAGTPQPIRIEVCISRTKGRISNDPANHYAAITSVTGSLAWYTREVAGRTRDNVKNEGAAWAPASEGPWFVNLRYTYDAAVYGSAAPLQTSWNNGPFA